jgi:hypothetical protein
MTRIRQIMLQITQNFNVIKLGFKWHNFIMGKKPETCHKKAKTLNK